MTLILDAGALIAIERSDQGVMNVIKREQVARRRPVTHGGVVGQVWRGGHDRQANLARTLPGIHVVALDDDLGKRAGVLLAQVGGASDVVNAAVTLLANDGDQILTSDMDDLRLLLAGSERRVTLTRI